MSRIVICLCIVLVSSWVHAAPLEPEEAKALETPYCIDMRIAPELGRSSPEFTSAALGEMFGCRQVYQWPMSVKPDRGMIARYSSKMKQFSRHPVLMWCTHGVRTGEIQAALSTHDHPVHSLKGGLLYLQQTLNLR